MTVQFRPLTSTNLLLVNHFNIDSHRRQLHVSINFQNSVHDRPQNSLDVGQTLGFGGDRVREGREKEKRERKREKGEKKRKGKRKGKRRKKKKKEKNKPISFCCK